MSSPKVSLAGWLTAASFISGLGFAQAQYPYTNSTLKVASLSTGASCACTQLASKYGDLVLGTNSSTYAAEIINFWDVRSDLEPKCVFMPTTADQVAAAVSTFTSCGTQFAIRGGGHMNFPGANNIDGGVLVALNGLNEAVVSADNSTIAVGPGNTWVDVYSALDPYGLYCIGGRLKTIGVPGLELIGGFHWLINKYGFAMDNVVSYDIVLGDGTQVVANATTNPDLFWSLKGGSSNYGIVTKFVLKTFPIPLVSTTVQIFNETVTDDFIAATVQMAAYNDAEIAAGSVASLSYNATTKKIGATLFGLQEGTESPPSRFANYSAIPSVVAQYNVSSPLVWHDQFDTPNQMFRVEFGHKTILAEAEEATAQMIKIFEAWKLAVDEISDVEGLYPTFVLNIMSKSSMTVAKNNGIGNTWGLDDDKSLLIWQISTGWANASDDLRMRTWVRQFIDYWHQENEALGIASDFIYMGDAGDFQDPYSALPIENVRRMRETRDNYDPLGVFSRLNWGGYKLGF